ncbi:MAG TPA: response regulator transcription factor [Terriglobia bacterium]|jgi:two-component system phosphate regulon response regulator PhoB
MERVLIVDDDPDIQRLVSYNLSQAGFQVTAASSGRTALEAVQQNPPDLIILDVMMPDIDGMEVCRTLRQRENSRRIPIIMLTARGDEIDRVVGFELGADDYVMKPFSPRELVLRVKSIFRRVGDGRTETLRAGTIQLLPQRRQVLVGDTPVVLTAKEFDLLYELMRAGGNVLTREFLMDKVWGYHGDATSRTLDTHVRRLREKLGAEGDLVETVRSVGYRLAQGADG